MSEIDEAENIVWHYDTNVLPGVGARTLEINMIARLCTALRTAQAELAEARGRDNICLLCGRDTPCMTDAEELANGGPGAPCTFERPLTPPTQDVSAERERIKQSVEEVRRDIAAGVRPAGKRFSLNPDRDREGG